MRIILVLLPFFPHQREKQEDEYGRDKLVLLPNYQPVYHLTSL